MICSYCDATVLTAATPAVGGLAEATIELNGLLDKYWMGDNSKTNAIAMCAAQQKCKDALAAQPAPLRERDEDWHDDPSSDERWNAGVDCVMKLLCDFLGVHPETVGGDISAVISNILRTKYGEDWGPNDGAIYAAVSKVSISETEYSEMMRDVDAKLGDLSASPPEQPAAQLTDEMIKAGAEAMIASDTQDGPAYTTLARACLSAALGVDGYVAPETATTPTEDPSE